MTERAPYQLLPPLEQEQFELLKEDIRRRGVLVPIERDENGELLDGHHRMRAVEELKKEGVVCDPPVILRLDMSEAQKKAHVRALNLHRRHLTRAQRREPLLLSACSKRIAIACANHIAARRAIVEQHKA